MSMRLSRTCPRLYQHQSVQVQAQMRWFHRPLVCGTMKVVVLAWLMTAKRSKAEVRSVSRVHHSACLERGQSYWDYENFQLSSLTWDDVDRYEVIGALGFGRFSEATARSATPSDTSSGTWSAESVLESPAHAAAARQLQQQGEKLKEALTVIERYQAHIRNEEQNSLALTGENLTLLQDQGELNRQLHILREENDILAANKAIFQQEQEKLHEKFKARAKALANINARLEDDRRRLSDQLRAVTGNNKDLEEEVSAIKRELAEARRARDTAEARALEIEARGHMDGGTGLTAAMDRWASGDIFEEMRASGWPEGIPAHALKDGSPALREGKVLGKGGFGTVIEVYQGSKTFALKMASPESPWACQMAVREMLALRRVTPHANVVTAVAMDDRVASKPILMEQAVTDLCDPVFRENSVGATSAQVLRFVAEAANGLSHVHESGIIHQDIKPSNILIVHEGAKLVAKIADFGLACGYGEMRAQRLGTIGYIPPANLLGPVAARPCHDIFALGALAAQVLLQKCLRLHNIFTHPNLLSPANRLRAEELAASDSYDLEFDVHITVASLQNENKFFRDLLCPENMIVALARKSVAIDLVKSMLFNDVSVSPSMEDVATTFEYLSMQTESAYTAASDGILGSTPTSGRT